MGKIGGGGHCKEGSVAARHCRMEGGGRKQIFGSKCKAGLHDHATRKVTLMHIPARAWTTDSGNDHVAGGVCVCVGGGGSAV